MTDLECKRTQAKLVEIIRKWKLNQNVIAESAGIGVSAFKNKLNGLNNGYRFNEGELLRIGTAMDKMVGEIEFFLGGLDSDSDDLL